MNQASNQHLLEVLQEILGIEHCD